MAPRCRRPSRRPARASRRRNERGNDLTLEQFEFLDKLIDEYQPKGKWVERDLPVRSPKTGEIVMLPFLVLVSETQEEMAARLAARRGENG